MRRALCVGVNSYPGLDGADLSGCIEDARLWARFLQPGCVKEGVVATLLANPSRMGLIRELRAEIEALRRGDTLWFTFSGHGTYLPDENGDEPDKQDECICPSDLAEHGPIVDDELHALIASRPFGSKVVVVSDSCYSGTVAKAAQLVVGKSGKLEVKGGGKKSRFIPPQRWDPRRTYVARTVSDPCVTTTTPQAVDKKRWKDEAWITMAGCQSDEVSWDTQAGGAFTMAALRAWRQGMTFRQWMGAIELPTQQFPQTPKLTGSWWAKGRKALA